MISWSQQKVKKIKNKNRFYIDINLRIIFFIKLYMDIPLNLVKTRFSQFLDKTIYKNANCLLNSH
jgi:hypothetical protein